MGGSGVGLNPGGGMRAMFSLSGLLAFIRAWCTRWPLSCASRSISRQSLTTEPQGESK